MTQQYTPHNAPYILSWSFVEVIVPTHPGAIDSEEASKPLHMLPVGGKDGWSVQFDQLPKLIVKCKLSNGVIGIGEFYRGHQRLIIDEVAVALLGTQLSKLTLQDLPIPLSREYDGFECAIWDAYAKWLGIPMYALLGGKVRNAIKVGSWSSHRTINEVGPVAARFREQGYDSIKFKSDLEDDDTGWCRKIAEQAPGMKVIFDPNERWENASEARRRLKKLEAIGNVLALEDPLPKWMYQEYAELRRVSDIPIIQHISLPYVLQGQRIQDAINCLTHGSIDGFNFNAGFAKFRQLDAIACAANLYCWHGSEVDLGILEAMYVHQSAAARSCIWPSDIFGRMIRSHDLLVEPLQFKPPFVYLPDGPGLGVDIDEMVLEKFTVDRFEIK